MSIAGLIPLVQAHPAYRRLRAALTDALAAALAGGDSQSAIRNPPSVRAGDVLDAAKPYLLAALASDPEVGVRRILVVSARPERAREVAAALDLYTPDPERVLLFPPPDVVPYERIAPDPQITAARLEVLAALAPPDDGAANNPPSFPFGGLRLRNPQLVVASAAALMTPTFAPTDFRWATRRLSKGETVDVNDLLAHWLDLGYQPTSVVEDPGYFSRRGGIIDVWPPTSVRPVRIELWGDEIESLRLFHPDTQRSENPVDSIVIPPSCELPLWRSQEALADLYTLDSSTTRPEVQEDWARQLDQLAAGESFEGRELFTAYFTDPPASLLDYCGPGDLIIVDEPEAVRLATGELERAAEELYTEFVNTGELPSGLRAPYIRWDDLAPRLNKIPQLEIGALDIDEGTSQPPTPSLQPLPLPAFEPPKLYTGNIATAIDDVGAMLAAGQRVVIVSQQAERLRELFEEADIYPTRRKLPPGARKPSDDTVPKSKIPNPKSDTEPLLDPPAAGALHLLGATLDEGWRCFPMQLTLLTDLELFGRQPQRRRAVKQASRTAAIEEFLRDLKPGDYVVHIEHGIARYAGLVKRVLGAPQPEGRGTSPLPHTEEDVSEREYMLLEYADGDRLYVPIEQTDRVSVYIGTGTSPQRCTGSARRSGRAPSAA
jgi:transcription-repair coupling factor (superfamily II helicase)